MALSEAAIYFHDPLQFWLFNHCQNCTRVRFYFSGRDPNFSLNSSFNRAECCLALTVLSSLYYPQIRQQTKAENNKEVSHLFLEVDKKKVLQETDEITNREKFIWGESGKRKLQHLGSIEHIRLMVFESVRGFSVRDTTEKKIHSLLLSLRRSVPIL